MRAYPYMHADTRIWILGIYRHIKGSRYQVLEVATDSETNKYIVVYRNLSTGTTWTREAAEWREFVKWPDDVQRPRFSLEELQQPDEAEDFSYLFKKLVPVDH